MKTTSTALRFRPAHVSAFERFNTPTTCDCCGREGLKKTVKVSNGTSTLWMGTGCAMKACKMGEKSFGKAQAEAAQLGHKLYLDRVCPEFSGQWMRQMSLVGASSQRLAEVYDRTGKMDQMTPEEGRANYGRACTAIANGIPYKLNGSPVLETFDGEDRAIAASYARAAYVAWRGEEDAARRGIGSHSWLENLNAMF